MRRFPRSESVSKTNIVPQMFLEVENTCVVEFSLQMSSFLFAFKNVFHLKVMTKNTTKKNIKAKYFKNFLHEFAFEDVDEFSRSDSERREHLSCASSPSKLSRQNCGVQDMQTDLFHDLP